MSDPASGSWFWDNIWWMSLSVEAVICFVTAVFIFNHYGSFRHLSIYVPLLVISGWLLCFMMVFLIPLDVVVASSCDQPLGCDKNYRCEFQDNDKTTAMMWIWKTLYWSTFFLTWAVYPIMQSYSLTGEFTVGERLRSAIRSNVLLYSIGLCVVNLNFLSICAEQIIFAIIYIIWTYKQGSGASAWEGLPSVAIQLGNMWGLFIVISLLGHGLVNVPRRMWRRANKPVTLKRLQFEAVSYSYKLEDAKIALQKTLKKVRKAAEITSPTDPYRQYVDVIVGRCPSHYEEVLFGEGNVEITYGKLAALNARLMDEHHQVELWQSRYDRTLDDAFDLLDLLKAKNTPDVNTITWSFRRPPSNKMVAVLQYYWYCYFESMLLRSMSILCVTMGVIIAWSELVFVVTQVDLSVFSLIVRIPNLVHILNGLVMQATVFVPVSYIMICVVSSLFRLRLFDYYHLVPAKRSNANSLLFSASYMCRTTAPIAYNFILMIHYCDTPFLRVMGKLDLGILFQTLFPMLLVPFSLLTLFNVYSRVLNCLHIRRFQFDEDFTDSQIEEGEELLSLERERRMRGSSQETSMSAVRRRGPYNASGSEIVESGDTRFSSSRSSLSKSVMERGNELSPSHNDGVGQEVADSGVSLTQRISSKFSSLFGGRANSDFPTDGAAPMEEINIGSVNPPTASLTNSDSRPSRAEARMFGGASSLRASSTIATGGISSIPSSSNPTAAPRFDRIDGLTLTI